MQIVTGRVQNGLRIHVHLDEVKYEFFDECRLSDLSGSSEQIDVARPQSQLSSFESNGPFAEFREMLVEVA